MAIPKIRNLLRLRQDALVARTAPDRRFAGDDHLHALLRLDPGATARGPSGAVVNAQFQPEPLALLRRMLDQYPPLRAVELDGTPWSAARCVPAVFQAWSDV